MVPPTRSRLLAVVLLLTGVALAWALLISPVVSDLRFEQQEFSQNLERLERYERLRADEVSLRAAVGRLDKTISSVYDGPNAAGVAATLQRDVGDLARSSGLNIGSIRPLANDELTEVGFQKHTIRVELNGSTAQLAAFLDNLRRHPKLLIVDRANIRSLNPGSDETAATLAMSIEIVGFGQVIAS